MTYRGDDIVNLAIKAMQKPSDFGWWGNDEMFVTWGWSGIVKHRDSDLLEISNFDFISNDLISAFPEDFNIVGVGHWAVGHLDQLIVRILKNEDAGFVEDNITDAFKHSMGWVDTLSEYPVACDLHYSMLVMDKVHEYGIQILPDEIYINDNPHETVNEILFALQEQYDYDYDTTVPTDYEMKLAAYSLGLCDYDSREFWDEFVFENHLAVIAWDDVTMAPKGEPRQIPGQLSFNDIQM